LVEQAVVVDPLQVRPLGVSAPLSRGAAAFGALLPEPVLAAGQLAVSGLVPALVGVQSHSRTVSQLAPPAPLVAEMAEEVAVGLGGAPPPPVPLAQAPVLRAESLGVPAPKLVSRVSIVVLALSVLPVAKLLGESGGRGESQLTSKT